MLTIKKLGYDKDLGLLEGEYIIVLLYIYNLNW